jgi:hypothetical protein
MRETDDRDGGYGHRSPGFCCLNTRFCNTNALHAFLSPSRLGIGQAQSSRASQREILVFLRGALFSRRRASLCLCLSICFVFSDLIKVRSSALCVFAVVSRTVWVLIVACADSCRSGSRGR